MAAGSRGLPQFGRQAIAIAELDGGFGAPLELPPTTRSFHRGNGRRQLSEALALPPQVGHRGHLGA